MSELNKNNTKSDFRAYQNDEIMQRVLNGLNQEVLDEEEWKHAKSFEEMREELLALKPDFVAEAREEWIKIGEARGIELGKAEAAAVEREKMLEIARTLKKSGVSIDLIEKTTKLKREEIEKL